MKHAQTPLMESMAAAPAVLYLAFELGVKTWHLRFGNGVRHRNRTLNARDLFSLWQEIALAKEKLKLPEETLIVSCFEAGRDGHWLHRALTAQGIHNLEVSSTSIKVSQQGKHVKTDRLDVQALHTQLYHYCQGERDALQVVNVPSREDEDAMRLARELKQLKKERTQHTNRMGSALIRYSLRLEHMGGKGWEKIVLSLRDWSGQPLPGHAQQELIRENQRLLLVKEQITALEVERSRQIAEGEGHNLDQIRRLMLLRGIGPVISWTLVMEFFGWRAFRNKKQVGSLAGLTGTPFNSGKIQHEQGISKMGSPRVRALAIEMAWLWVRLQPNSKHSRWFRKRYAGGGSRQRKIGIVAVARRLLIDLWRYLEEGIVPEGAILKQV